MSINYDILDTFSISLQNSIEYIYATDGRRLRTKHYRLLPNSSYSSLLQRGNLYRQIGDSTDYVGNLILKNGKPQMYIFSGGYYSFNGDNKPECHYYVQDYQGNNRMVVNKNGTIEQITHYYPYGELMADISTNPTKQEYKYSGKELDRTFGLDLYDYHARQQDPKLGCFTSIDPLAEKYYWISPYAYCAGDPVNLVDPDGKDIYKLTPNGFIFNVQETSSSHLIAERDGHQVFFGNVDNSLMSQLSVKPHEMSKERPVKTGEEPTEANIHSDAKGNMHSGTTESNDAFQLFRFLSDNTSVEWCLSLSTNGMYTFTTNQSKKQVNSNKEDNANNEKTIHTHNEDETPEAGSADLRYATNENCQYYIYYPKQRIVIQYNGSNAKMNETNINDFGF